MLYFLSRILPSETGFVVHLQENHVLRFPDNGYSPKEFRQKFLTPTDHPGRVERRTGERNEIRELGRPFFKDNAIYIDASKMK